MSTYSIETPFVPKCGFYWADVEDNTDINLLIKKTKIKLDFNLSKNELFKFKENNFIPGVGLIREKLPEWYDESTKCKSLDLVELSERTILFTICYHSVYEVDMDYVLNWKLKLKD